LTAANGIEEHPGHVRIVGFGVGVRQFFRSAPHSISSQKASLKDEIARLRDELTSQLTDKLENQLTEKLKDK